MQETVEVVEEISLGAVEVILIEIEKHGGHRGRRHPHLVCVTVDGDEKQVRAGRYRVHVFKRAVGVDATYELEEFEEEVAWKAFQVLEFFRQHHAECLELAEARANGTDLRRLAGSTNRSHSALLQRWSRCMKRLKAAIERGELGCTWWADSEDAGR